MQIRVNGEGKEVPDGSSVATLIELLELNPRFLAVERNRELVPRQQHADCQLEEGDEIEIVTLVGGG